MLADVMDTIDEVYMYPDVWLRNLKLIKEYGHV
jgi:hypothetical protein